MLEKLRVDHMTTSFYYPKNNERVEALHCTMQDLFWQRVADNKWSWDIHFNQTLEKIGFNENETTKSSPFKLVYSRDVVLPLDNT